MPNQKPPQGLPPSPCIKCVHKKGCRSYETCKSWLDWLNIVWPLVCGRLRGGH